MHAGWVLILQNFNFVFKHGFDAVNKVANALNRKGFVLAVVQREITGYEDLKQQYPEDKDFGGIWKHRLNKEKHRTSAFLEAFYSKATNCAFLILLCVCILFKKLHVRV